MPSKVKNPKIAKSGQSATPINNTAALMIVPTMQMAKVLKRMGRMGGLDLGMICSIYSH
jgi:hypothetical protein